ncbi:MAG: hypothetical protein J5693_01735 [Bacteroidales bacterium]|nr:hypothetical protein [Bacteroidales bacterium]
MAENQKYKYTRPAVRLVSMSFYTPLLQVSVGSYIETPLDGEEIGDNE